MLSLFKNNKKGNEAGLQHPNSLLQLTGQMRSQHRKLEQGQEAAVAEQVRSLHITR